MNNHQVNQSGNCVIEGCPCRGWSSQITAAEDSRRQREASEPPAARGGGELPDIRLRIALAEVRAIHTKKAKAVNFDDCGCDYCVALEPFESDAALSDQKG